MQTPLEQLSRQDLIAKVEDLQFQLNELRRLVYGRKSERFVPDMPTTMAEREQAQQLAMQIGLFAPQGEQACENTTLEVAEASQAEQAPEQAPEQELEQIHYQRKKALKKKKNEGHPGRRGLPAHLDRITIDLQPEEDTTNMKFIGWLESESLAYQPGKLYVNRYRRAKYAQTPASQASSESSKPEAGKEVVCAPLPDYLLPKVIADPSLLAHLAVSKFVDHMPIDRIFKGFKRFGVDLPTSTAYDWMTHGANLLEPLYRLALLPAVLNSGYVQADESTIKVLDPNVKRDTHQGYMWVLNAPHLGLTYFHYHQGRDHALITQLLKDYEGKLQTDGYTVYDAYENHPDIDWTNCHGHARREFEKAKDNDQKRAQTVLILYQKLYQVEREARDLGLDVLDRRKLRQEKAKPILTQLENYLEEQALQVLPKSPIGKAMAYYLKRKALFRKYLDDGLWEIDNNLIENTIRPLALGRKNYLFAGSHEAAQRAAIYYSFFACCAQANINPFEYLTDVFRRILNHPVNRIHELLPDQWKPITLENGNKKAG
jgi:transposase